MHSIWFRSSKRRSDRNTLISSCVWLVATTQATVSIRMIAIVSVCLADPFPFSEHFHVISRVCVCEDNLHICCGVHRVESESFRDCISSYRILRRSTFVRMELLCEIVFSAASAHCFISNEKCSFVLFNTRMARKLRLVVFCHGGERIFVHSWVRVRVCVCVAFQLKCLRKLCSTK